MNAAASLSRADLMRYAALAFPLSFAGLPLYIHAPDFYATDTVLTLSLIGAILMGIRIFDAVQDPLIGIFSDKYAARRSHIMAASAFAMAAGFIMLFHPVPEFTAIWFGAAMLITTTAFSVLMINLNALGSLWSEDPVEKTRITSWREGIGLIGLLAAAVLPTVMGFTLFSVLFALILAGATWLCLSWHKKVFSSSWHPVLDPGSSQAAGSLDPGLRRDATEAGEGSYSFNPAIFLKPEMRGFFALYGVSMLASSIPAVLVLFFIRDLLGAEELNGAFLFLYFLSGALGMGLWMRLSERKDAAKAWLVSMLLAVAMFVWAFFLGPGDVVAYGVICVLSGMALGAELALPPAILSELIDRAKDKKQSGAYFAGLAFLSKAALALASGLAFLILGQTTFEAGADNTPAALQTLSFTYALLPCLIKLAAAAMLFQWIQSRKKEDSDAHTLHNTYPAGGGHGS